MANLIERFRALPWERKDKLIKAGLIFGVLAWNFVSTYLEAPKLIERAQYIKHHPELQLKPIHQAQEDSDDLAWIGHVIAWCCLMFFVIRLERTRNRGAHLLINKPKALTTVTVHTSREAALNDVVMLAQKLGLRIERLDLEKGTLILGDDRRALIDWGWYLAVYIEDFQTDSVTVSIGAENKVKKAVAHASALAVQQKFIDEVRSYFISKDRKIA